MSIRQYWWLRLATDRAQLRAAAEAMKRIIDATEVPLAAPSGAPASQVLYEDGGVEGVYFNGKEPDGREAFLWPVDLGVYLEEGGVIFNLHREGSWVEGWPATNCLPYEEVVMACLLAAKAALGDELVIDSECDLDQWAAAASLYRRALGTDPPWPPWSEADARSVIEGGPPSP